MIYDEGIFGTLKIIRNAMKAENREQFKRMFKTFNDPEHKLHFIAVCSQNNIKNEPHFYVRFAFSYDNFFNSFFRIILNNPLYQKIAVPMRTIVEPHFIALGISSVIPIESVSIC